MNLQHTKSQHANNRALDTPVKLDIPQQEDGQSSKDPIAENRHDSDCV
jgi:hypothetical protein